MTMKRFGAMILSLFLALSVMTPRLAAQTTFDLSVSHLDVTGTATLIATGTSSGVYLTVKNTSAATVFLGPSDVTTSNGFALAQGDVASFLVRNGQALYGITSGSTSTLNLINGLQSAKVTPSPSATGFVGTLATTNGGTGLNSYTQGDLLYSSASNVLSKLGEPGVASPRRYLATRGSLGANPSWQQLLLDASTVDNTSLLGAGQGGTGLNGYSLGDTIYGFSTSQLNKLSGNTTTTPKVLQQTGNGSASAAPAWTNTPTLTLTNGTGLPVGTGISGLGTNVATALATPSSANIAAAVTDETGSGALVFGSGPTITLANGTGLPISTGVSGLGTGIATALAVNTGSAGAPVLFNGALGTPSSGTLSSATGLPISTGVSGLGTGVATFLGTPSSANLATAVTDETGSGALVFGTGPTITLANGTGLPVATGISGLGTGVATFLATPSSANLAGAVTNETGSGALVFGTAPTITLDNGTGLPVSTGISGLGTGVATFLATPSSSNLSGALTDETGSGGAAVFASSPTITTPTFTTSATTPLINGGTGTTSTLTLQPTSGNGTTGADVLINTGNNGGTASARFFTTNTAAQIGVPCTASGCDATGLFALQLTAGTSATAFAFDRFNAAAGGSLVLGRHARGTISSPGQTQLNDSLMQVAGRGWETTTPGFVAGNIGSFNILAAENITNAAQGTKLTMVVTPIGSTTQQTILTVHSGGVLTAGSTPTVANVGANSCGTTTATIAGNNVVGEVTVGATSGTQCRVTMTQAATTRFNGSCSNQSTANLCRLVAVSTTTFDLVGTFVAGDVVAYAVFSR